MSDNYESNNKQIKQIFEAQKASPSIYLMCRNTPVLRFHSSRGELEILDKTLVPYPLRGQIVSVPDGSYFEENKIGLTVAANIIGHNNELFKSYIGNRVLNLTRSNAKYLLNSFNFSQSDDINEKFKIALACHGISMSDSYWLKSEDDIATWDDRNIHKVSLSKIVATIALDGKILTVSGDPDLTPEFLSKGAFAKAWMRGDDGFCYLRKRGLSGRDVEPKREVEASNVMDCFDVNHVRYELVQDEKGYMSKCRCVADDNRGMVDVSGLKSRYDRFDDSGFSTFTEYVLAHDKTNALKMVMMDFVCSNSDRHIDNWGFYQNYDKGTLDGLYPLMDFNMCFDEPVMELEDGGPCRSLSDWDVSQAEAALIAKSEIGIPQISDVTPDMFYDKDHYDSYCERMDWLRSNELKNACGVRSECGELVAEDAFWRGDGDSDR